MVPRLLLVVLFAAACYDPAPHASCAIACDFAGAGASAPCPSGLVCGPHGRCTSAADETCDAVDAGTDAPLVDAARCFGSLPGLPASEVCLPTPPTGDLVLTDPISTNDCARGMHIMIAESRYCVISAARINVPVIVTATGGHPLLLLGSESITIDTFGGIDASTRQSGVLGAGADWGGCAMALDAIAARGGGAGATFQGNGGNGGGPGGGLRAPSTLGMAFHGGCWGGSGAPVANGGRGGGALFLAAPRITVRGSLAAAGQGGGAGAGSSQGGGGGGSGGFISLVGTTIEIDSAARLIASGGGGGGGRDASSGTALPGESASATDPSPQGGDGQSAAGGGDGSQPFDLNGAQGSTSNDSTTGGSGGGGGGAGYIEIREAGTPMSCSPFVCIPAASL